METKPERTGKSPKRNNKSPKKTNNSLEKTDENAVESEHPRLQTAVPVSQISSMIVAVITAAIAATRGNSACDVRIASVKPVGPVVSLGDLWTQFGRIEAMNSRQKFFARKGI